MLNPSRWVFVELGVIPLVDDGGSVLGDHDFYGSGRGCWRSLLSWFCSWRRGLGFLLLLLCRSSINLTNDSGNLLEVIATTVKDCAELKNGSTDSANFMDVFTDVLVCSVFHSLCVSKLNCKIVGQEIIANQPYKLMFEGDVLRNGEDGRLQLLQHEY